MEGILGRILPRRTFTDLFVLGITFFAVSICSLSFSSYIFAYSKTKRSNNEYSFISGAPLPPKYSINSNLLSSITEKGSKNTSWLTFLSKTLSSQYKQQGIDKNYMKNDEFVSFSSKAIENSLKKLCKENPNSLPCINSFTANNSLNRIDLTEYISFIKEFPELKHSVVPESCFENQENEQCIKSNPLEFSVEKMFITTNIRDIKQHLYEMNIPVALTMAIPQQRYVFDCGNNLVKDSRSCLNQDYPCIHDSSKFCSVYDFPPSREAEVDSVMHNTGKTVPGEIHTFSIVGFNDNFVPMMNKGNPTGGFIVENSWGKGGHTLEYLMGQITEEQDAMFCPNKDDVFRWVPASVECMIEKGSPAKCSTDAMLQRGNTVIKHADELVCVNATHCEVGETYTLLRENPDSLAPSIKLSESGVPLARVIHYGKNITAQPQLARTLPIQHLYYALQLKKENQKKPIREGCGFSFIPYSLAQDAIRMSTINGPGVFVSEGIKVKWEERSYKESKYQLDYSFIDKSTTKINPINPKDPLQTEL